MISKKYDNFFKKINILKENLGDLEEIDNIEDKFLMELGRISNEEDISDIIVRTGIIHDMQNLSKKLDFQNKNYFDQLNIFDIKTLKKKICKLCGSKQTTTNLQLICENCGLIEYLGNLWYEEKGKINKLKDYRTVDRCEDWLFLLQGKVPCKLPNIIEEQLEIEMIKKCMVGGVFMSSKLTCVECKDIRIWLKNFGASTLNDYIPYIHKIMTRKLGHEILPVQFTNEQEKIILNDWKFLSETYCDFYAQVKRKNNKKNNNPYYPMCIYFIVKERFPKLAPTLYKYIHKQTAETMQLREECWFKTVKKLNYPKNVR